MGLWVCLCLLRIDLGPYQLRGVTQVTTLALAANSAPFISALLILLIIKPPGDSRGLASRLNAPRGLPDQSSIPHTVAGIRTGLF